MQSIFWRLSILLKFRYKWWLEIHSTVLYNLKLKNNLGQSFSSYILWNRLKIKLDLLVKAPDISNTKMDKNDNFARAGDDLVNNTEVYKFSDCQVSYWRVKKSNVAGNTHEYLAISKLLIKLLIHKLERILADRLVNTKELTVSLNC
jgi:hypothetical protein